MVKQFYSPKNYLFCSIINELKYNSPNLIQELKSEFYFFIVG